MKLLLAVFSRGRGWREAGGFEEGDGELGLNIRVGTQVCLQMSGKHWDDSIRAFIGGGFVVGHLAVVLVHERPVTGSDKA